MRAIPHLLLILCVLAIARDAAAAPRTKITVYAKTARGYSRPTHPRFSRDVQIGKATVVEDDVASGTTP